ncbi:uncharacterized [Tachysurus ichikawai]
MDLWPENDPIVVPTCGLWDGAVGHRCTNEDLMDYYDQSRVSVFVFVSVAVRYGLWYGLCFLLHADGWTLLAAGGLSRLLRLSFEDGLPPFDSAIKAKDVQVKSNEGW